MIIKITIESPLLNIMDLRKAVSIIDNAFSGNHPLVAVSVIHGANQTSIVATDDSDES